MSVQTLTWDWLDDDWQGWWLVAVSSWDMAYEIVPCITDSSWGTCRARLHQLTDDSGDDDDDDRDRTEDDGITDTSAGDGKKYDCDWSWLGEENDSSDEKYETLETVETLVSHCWTQLESERFSEVLTEDIVQDGSAGSDDDKDILLWSRLTWCWL